MLSFNDMYEWYFWLNYGETSCLHKIKKMIVYILDNEAHSALNQFWIELQTFPTRPWKSDIACFRDSEYVLHEILDWRAQNPPARQCSLLRPNRVTSG